MRMRNRKWTLLCCVFKKISVDKFLFLLHSGLFSKITPREREIEEGGKRREREREREKERGRERG